MHGECPALVSSSDDADVTGRDCLERVGSSCLPTFPTYILIRALTVIVQSWVYAFSGSEPLSSVFWLRSLVARPKAPSSPLVGNLMW